MWLVVLCGTLGVGAAVALFLRRIIDMASMPAYIVILAYVAFFIPPFTILLLPIDLASGMADSLNTSQDAEWPLAYLDSYILLKLWRISYWLSFALTLTILPITQAFVESGQKEFTDRLIASVRKNLRYQVMYALIGLLAMIYIFLNTKLRSFQDFKSLLIALINTWGLFLAINFLGHGLVNVPRRLWHSANYRRQMNELEKTATLVHERLDQTRIFEEDLALQVLVWEKTNVDPEWLQDVRDLIPEAMSRARGRSLRTTQSWFSSNKYPQNPSEDLRTDLMQRLNEQKRRRYEAEWDDLVKRYTYLDDCTRASSRHALRFRSFHTRMDNKSSYWCYTVMIPIGRRLIAASCVLLSASLLWAELFINLEKPFLRFVVLPITTWNIEICSACIMMYMAICCYSTLLRLKIFSTYALLDRRNTSPSSLFFYASYCCRVTIPLSYNFINLLPAPHREASTFSRFLGQAIDLQPLGVVFNSIIPLYILVPVCLTMVNSYDRLKSSLGFNSSWLDDDDAGDSSAQAGRDQLLREMGKRYGELDSALLQQRAQQQSETDVHFSDMPSDLVDLFHSTEDDPASSHDAQEPLIPTGITQSIGAEWLSWGRRITNLATSHKDFNTV